MVVWFRHGPCTVGVEHGVVRGTEFAALTDLLEAAATLERTRDEWLIQAHAQIDAEQAQARTQADAWLEDARQQRETAHAQGLDAGYQQGLADAAQAWTHQVIDAATTTHESLRRQSDRLAHIVTLALERIIEQEDRTRLFERALRHVSRIVAELPMASLRVHPDELAAAKAAVATLSATSGEAPLIEVVADATLTPGSCVFESDQGVIDAGLSAQLAALRRAMDRAARALASEDEALLRTQPPADLPCEAPSLTAPEPCPADMEGTVTDERSATLCPGA
jgi:type III secretion protein L